MNPTLLAKLKSINPTEGEWTHEFEHIFCSNSALLVFANANDDDRTLITLAPAMRQELLKREEECTHVRGMLRQLSAINEDHEYFKCIAGLIQQSREYLRNTNP